MVISTPIIDLHEKVAQGNLRHFDIWNYSSSFFASAMIFAWLPLGTSS